MKIYRRTKGGWTDHNQPNKSDTHCDKCGDKLWVNPSGGLYCNGRWDSGGGKMQCHHCDEGKLVEGLSKFWVVCDKCEEQHDLCQYCYEAPCDIDDEGLIICNKCYAEKRHHYERRNV